MDLGEGGPFQEAASGLFGKNGAASCQPPVKSLCSVLLASHLILWFPSNPVVPLWTVLSAFCRRGYGVSGRWMGFWMCPQFQSTLANTIRFLLHLHNWLHFPECLWKIVWPCKSPWCPTPPGGSYGFMFYPPNILLWTFSNIQRSMKNFKASVHIPTTQFLQWILDPVCFIINLSTSPSLHPLPIHLPVSLWCIPW